MSDTLDILLKEAFDPTTPPQRLRILASYSSVEVRRAVASNPNCSEDLLARLSVHFPREVINNDVFDLMLFVNPNWLAEIPDFARNALIGSPEAPEGFLRWAFKNGDTDTLLSILRNPKAPAALVDEMVAFNVPAVREAAQMHVAFETSPVPNALWWADLESDSFELRQMVLSGIVPSWLSPRLVREPDTLMRQSLAQSSNSLPDVLEALLFDEDEEVRKLAKANPRTPEKSLKLLDYLEGVGGGASGVEQPSDLPPLELLAKGHFWLRQRVAQHPATEVFLLERLALDDDWRVRQVVARNLKTPVANLEQLSYDHDKDVRMAVAQNPSVSLETLERLVADENEEVRKAAAENPKAPKGVLELFERMEAQDAALSPEELTALARRSEWAKRLAASHPNTPPETLEGCRQEPDWHTRLAVARNPKAPPEVLASLVGDTDAEVRQAVAAHPNTPLSSLEALLSDDLPDVRQQLVGNPRLSQELLVRLGRDMHWKVREAVAAHPLTPAEVLTELSQDADRDVQQAVATNPHVPEAALETLFSGWFAKLEAPLGLTELYRRISASGEVPSNLLGQFAEGNEWAKRLAARHPATPDTALWKLSTDEDWRVRQAVAQNPAASAELLERMAQDTDVDVRRAVALHLNVSDETLDRFALDEQQDLRLKVAEHPRASTFALTKLLSDEDDAVRQAARANTRTLPEQVELHVRAEAFDLSLEVDFLHQLFAASTWGRTCVTENPSAPAELLAQAVSDTDWRVRQALAKNPKTAAEALATLSHDADRDVRQAVAEHPNTPQETLLALLGDADENVRFAVLRNPNLKPEALTQHRTRLVVQASRSRYPLNRALALSQPDLSPLELRKLRHRTAPHWIVRYALTQNPNTPTEVLEFLCGDGNRWVAEKAKGSKEQRKAGKDSQKI